MRQSAPTCLSRAETSPAKAANRVGIRPPCLTCSCANLSAKATASIAWCGGPKGGTPMADADIHWAEYIKASSDALILLKALYPLLPKGGDQIEANVEAAEKALQSA